MSTSNFTTAILVDQTPKEAFCAINNVRGWWSEEIEGKTDNLNEEFIYHYRDMHRCIVRIIEVIPDKKIVWLVKDNYFSFTKVKSEWRGTKINFDISKHINKTKISFTHVGLVPAYECFDICSNGWTDCIQNNLKNLIITGKGQPTSKEDDGFDVIPFVTGC